MPGTDDYGQDAPYPKLSDQPNAETAFGSLVNAIVPLTNMTFKNAADRAAAITAPVAGMESYLIAEGRKEYYSGTAWTTLTPGQWQPIPFSSTWVGRAGAPSYRILNGNVQFRGAGQLLTGLPLNGHAQYTIVSALPAEIRPTETRWFAVATEWVDALYARIEVTPDGLVHVITPTINPGPSWIGLDGITYSLT